MAVTISIVSIRRASLLVVPIVLAHLGDAVRSGSERGQPTRCVESFPRQHLGPVCRRLHGQLYGQPGGLHDHQGGLRPTDGHPGLEGA